MPTHDRLSVYAAIARIGAAPVFYDPDADRAVSISRACAAGGMGVLEFTNRGMGAPRVFESLHRILSAEMPGVILGAGSILDPGTAALFINSGANFIVGPAGNPAVARICNRRKVAYIPGCGTVSEVSAAEEWGCEIVKLFPADSSGGPGFIRDLLGPMPWSSIMPTGGIGIDRESLDPWFAAGAVAVGLGSALVSREIVDRRDWDELRRRCSETVSLIEEIRGRGKSDG